MAEVDVVFASYFKYFLLAVGIAFFGYRMIKPFVIEFYKRSYAWILDRVRINFNKAHSKRKEELFASLTDASNTGRRTRSRTSNKTEESLTVLEIGAGSGANFQFYPEGTNVICVDPNPYFESYLKERAHEFPHIKLKEFVVAYGEDMNMVPNESVDAAVCTLVLCNVQDQKKVLQSVRRVLKQGGKFYFVEHIAAESHTWLYKIQCLLTPIWNIVGDGCYLNRKTWETIEKAGFSNVQYERFYATKGPWIIRRLLFGTAVK